MRSYSMCMEIWWVPGWGGMFSSLHDAARVLCKGCLDPVYDHMQLSGLKISILLVCFDK